ncbi:YdiU family protein [Clostridium botulinum]|uniref:protein adenylyltransferase SelO n=1 Tax=Clostridium botulinum TaxID=1491 RepID=UPI0022455928|nr:YdiU family protein [Clostridium botulinum]UZP04765.1 YdiU family protein [Clostridium botulinum]UZP08177.1 YdiU family protein [Clostridium botulinum]UZP11504.1 YdiU family protein [Clostridium botulinum]
MKNKEVIVNNYLNLENTYIKLPKKLFSEQNPSEVPSANLVVFNESLASDLGLSEEFLQSNDGINFLSGNKILEDTIPIAQAYAGHQFGHFTMLGDGRAILLGELKSQNGERLDIQLKGSGRTPYSRGGDGKATLGPMLREYIISEGLYGLGIPTTRSLAVVSTGEDVMREEILQGAVLTRIAKSHIRVGTFQFVSNWGTVEELKALADYTLNRHFKKAEYEGNPYRYLLNEVIESQAKLISKWQLVGFVHGVMNTDNVTISGETIDYGPCAFMDVYDPDTVFSSIDINGRYAYGNQPKIGVWNLARFAETLLPLLDEDLESAVEIAQNSISKYSDLYNKYWYTGMRAKLGIFNEKEEDKELIQSLLIMMKRFKVDYTNTFSNLTLGNLSDIDMFASEEFKIWYEVWQERLKSQNQSSEESKTLMEKSNPTIIPRNNRVEEALVAAIKDSDYSVMQSLLDVLKNPYDYSSINEYYSIVPKSTSCTYKTYCGT